MNNTYLLYGDDAFLIDSKIKSIIGDNSIIKYDLNEININEALDDLLMPSLFTDKKYVVCNNCLFLSASKSEINHDLDYLTSYLENNQDNVLILVVPSKLDDRKKIVKDIRTKVEVSECNKLNNQELINYVKENLEDNNYKADDLIITKFIEKVGNNLYNINQELNKLFLYRLHEKIIVEEDIDILTSKQTIYDIFELVNAIIIKNKSRAIEAYHELLIYNEEPIKIIIMLANEFRLMYQTKVLRGNGYLEKDIAKTLEVHPYRVKLALEKCYKYDKQTLVEIIESLADIDINIKKGFLNKNVALEMFILGL